MQEVTKLSVYFLGTNYCGASQIIKKLVGEPLDREMEKNIPYHDVYHLPHHFLKDCQEIALELRHVAAWPTTRDMCRAAARYGRLAGIFVVFDILSVSSFAEAQKIMDCIEGIPVPVVLVGHMYEVAHIWRPPEYWKKVSGREAQEFAERHGAHYIEVSEVTGENMVEMMDLVVPGAIVHI